jgi:hypothetical protein
MIKLTLEDYQDFIKDRLGICTYCGAYLPVIHQQSEGEYCEICGTYNLEGIENAFNYGDITVQFTEQG